MSARGKWRVVLGVCVAVIVCAIAIQSRRPTSDGQRTLQSEPVNSPSPPSTALASLPAVRPSASAARPTFEGVTLHEEFPLDSGQEWKSAYSSRTTYTALFEGEPLWPPQQVIVMRDAQGNQTGMQSNYLPPSPPSNTRVLTAERARAIAEASLVDEDPQAKGYSGLAGTVSVDSVVWVEDRVAGAESRRAYRVVISGREQIIDATVGTVLSRRDRRQH